VENPIEAATTSGTANQSGLMTISDPWIYCLIIGSVSLKGWGLSRSAKVDFDNDIKFQICDADHDPTKNAPALRPGRL
jgi:hypothetical protein